MLIGIVGKPSSGKSTFLKAASLAEIETANFPFTTIKPNHAKGFIKIECPDKFFKTQCNPREGYCTNHNRFVPIDLLDVAGLVPGAHKGAGLGLQFLDDLNQAHALIHVIDISGSTNEKGEPVEPLSYDPINDIEFLEHELDMWYYKIINKNWTRFARQTQQTHTDPKKAIAKQLSGLKVTEDMTKEILKSFKETNLEKWDKNNIKQLAKQLRIKSKPMIIAANKIDVKGSEENLKKIKQKYPNYTIIECSAEVEYALKQANKKELIEYIPGEKEFKILKQLNNKQKQALKFIKENILSKRSTGIQEILNTVTFKILKQIAIFPGGVNKLEDKNGNTLPDCFLLKDGSTALDFAYRIHTDIGNKFVKAIDVKTKRPIGKDHKLKTGDVIEIKTS